MKVVVFVSRPCHLGVFFHDLDNPEGSCLLWENQDSDVQSLCIWKDQVRVLAHQKQNENRPEDGNASTSRLWKARLTGLRVRGELPPEGKSMGERWVQRVLGRGKHQCLLSGEESKVMCEKGPCPHCQKQSLSHKGSPMCEICMALPLFFLKIILKENLALLSKMCFVHVGKKFFGSSP